MPTIGLSVGVVDRLLDLPEHQLDDLRKAIKGGNEDRVVQYVREAGRFSTYPPMLYRHAAQAYAFDADGKHPTTVQRGALVVTAPFLANFDPAVFTDPASFNPGRPELKEQVMLFGWDRHRCLGEYVGLMIMTEIVKALFGCPFAVSPGRLGACRTGPGGSSPTAISPVGSSPDSTEPIFGTPPHESPKGALAGDMGLRRSSPSLMRNAVLIGVFGGLATFVACAGPTGSRAPGSGGPDDTTTGAGGSIGAGQNGGIIGTADGGLTGNNPSNMTVADPVPDPCMTTADCPGGGMGYVCTVANKCGKISGDCANQAECSGDSYCCKGAECRKDALDQGVCIPGYVPPGAACKGEAHVGVFSPAKQCEWPATATPRIFRSMCRFSARRWSRTHRSTPAPPPRSSSWPATRAPAKCSAPTRPTSESFAS